MHRLNLLLRTFAERTLCPAELTFIICVRPNSSSNIDPTPKVEDLIMVGDVNLFLKGAPDDEDFEAEAEIMIAGVCSIQ